VCDGNQQKTGNIPAVLQPVLAIVSELCTFLMQISVLKHILRTHHQWLKRIQLFPTYEMQGTNLKRYSEEDFNDFQRNSKFEHARRKYEQEILLGETSRHLQDIKSLLERLLSNPRQFNLRTLLEGNLFILLPKCKGHVLNSLLVASKLRVII